METLALVVSNLVMATWYLVLAFGHSVGLVACLFVLGWRIYRTDLKTLLGLLLDREDRLERENDRLLRTARDMIERSRLQQDAISVALGGSVDRARGRRRASRHPQNSRSRPRESPEARTRVPGQGATRPSLMINPRPAGDSS